MVNAPIIAPQLYTLTQHRYYSYLLPNNVKLNNFFNRIDGKVSEYKSFTLTDIIQFFICMGKFVDRSILLRKLLMFLFFRHLTNMEKSLYELVGYVIGKSILKYILWPLLGSLFLKSSTDVMFKFVLLTVYSLQNQLYD